MYDYIFFFSDGKGLTHICHGLHIDDCVAWSFLKLYIPLRVITLHLLCPQVGHNEKIHKESCTVAQGHKPFLEEYLG